MQNNDKIGAKIGATPPFHLRIAIVVGARPAVSFPFNKLNPHIGNLFTEVRIRSFGKGKLKLDLVAVCLVCSKLLL